MTRKTPFPVRALAAGAVALPLSFGAAPALAQMVCSDHAKIVKRLQDGYQEIRAGVGLAANGALIELYTSETDTFTIVLVRPNGMACLMAVGDGWSEIKPSTPVHDATASPDRVHGHSLPPM